MVGGLLEGQHRRDAGIGTTEHRRPLVPGAGGERGGEGDPQRCPVRSVGTIGHLLRQQTQTGEELGVETVLDRSDGHIPTVGAAVSGVVRRSPVKQVALPSVGPQACRSPGEHRLQQGRDPVDHRSVDHLTDAGPPAIQQRRKDSHHQERGPAGVIADQVERHRWRLVPTSDGVQSAGDCEVVDVVARRRRVGSVLSPARHPPVHQAGVGGAAAIRTDAQPFGDTRSHSFDQHIGMLDEPQHPVPRRLVGQIRPHDPPPAQHRIGRAVGDDVELTAGDPIDPHHVGTQVGQQHAGQRDRPDRGQLHHPDAGQRRLGHHPLGLNHRRPRPARSRRVAGSGTCAAAR